MPTRLEDQRMMKVSLDWNSQEGEPKSTVRRTVAEEARTDGKEKTALTMNRNRWKGFVSAICSHVE